MLLLSVSRRFGQLKVNSKIYSFIRENQRFESSGTESIKNARFARRAKLSPATASNQNLITPLRLGIISFMSLIGYCTYEIQTNKNGQLGKLYSDSPVEYAVSWVYKNTFGRFKEFYFPHDDKLLPTWPTDPVK